MTKAPLITLALCAFAGAACAQTPPPSPPRSISAADANGDGVVTRAEYDAAITAGFIRTDSNGDGHFTLAERRAVGGGPAGNGAPDPDANTDGIVTREEYFAYHGGNFERMDHNHDAELDAAEMAAR